MVQGLTARQAEVLSLIRDHLARYGMPPTRAEIADELGFRSPNAADDHLKALARKGAIALTPIFYLLAFGAMTLLVSTRFFVSPLVQIPTAVAVAAFPAYTYEIIAKPDRVIREKWGLIRSRNEAFNQYSNKVMQFEIDILAERRPDSSHDI